MPRGFGNTAFEPVPETRDKELTLGAGSLIGLALVLCALCGVFFVWGYSIGHHNITEAVAPPASTGPSAAQILSQSKPAPNPSSSQPPADSPSSTPADQEASSVQADGAAPVTAAYSPSNATSAAAGNPAVVEAALPPQQPSAVASAAGQVQSALNQGTAWMVQIAAVSHSEDADVLVSALRKRGYVVSSRRDPADNLLHVQVGPFATHADAASMRQRLLNDGYNAIIEP